MERERKGENERLRGRRESEEGERVRERRRE